MDAAGGLIGRIGTAEAAADEPGFVAGDALEGHELGREVITMDGFLGAGADGAGEVAEASARVADRLRADALK